MLRSVFSGRTAGPVGPLRLAALPLREEACHVFVAGVLEAELLDAVVLADCSGSATVMRLMLNLPSTLFASLAPVLLFRRRLKSVADVLKGIRHHLFTQT